VRILDLLFVNALLLAQIALTVAANILVKLGALPSDAAASMLGGVVNLKTLAGLACFGFAFLLYSLVLQRLALNVAQAILTLQYVCVIVAAAVFLNEPISSMRWMGMVIIIIGIGIVSFTI
jgi:multidrug transporter EmrE-like cation transporter